MIELSEIHLNRIGILGQQETASRAPYCQIIDPLCVARSLYAQGYSWKDVARVMRVGDRKLLEARRRGYFEWV
jgi:hypothetical protein